MTILNLTQHQASPVQVDAGVVEPADKQGVQKLLDFRGIPTKEDVNARAQALVKMCKDHGCKKAMIGGAPFFMAPLENALVDAGITVCYAFSQRESVEEMVDGQLIKKSVFVHLGFYEV